MAPQVPHAPVQAPSHGPAAAPSLNHSLHRCSLSPVQQESLHKLAALWQRVASQLESTLGQNTAPLTALPATTLTTIFSDKAPFVASWGGVRTVTDALKGNTSGEAREARELINGLHELKLITTLLASFGAPSFVLQSYHLVTQAARRAPELKPHQQRLYSHPLTVEALNLQLQALGIALINPQKPLHGRESFSFIAQACHSGFAADRKEEVIVERARELLATPQYGAQPLIIVTSPNHTLLLAARLRSLLQGDPSAEFISVATNSPFRHIPNGQRIVISSMSNLSHTSSVNPSEVIVYSPLILNDSQITPLSSRELSEVQALFSKSRISLLTLKSDLYTAEERICATLAPPTVKSGEIREPLTLPAVSSPPPENSQEKRALRHTRRARKSVTISVPQPRELLLFDQATLEALNPPPIPTPPPRELAQIDPATLPTCVEELNERLGIILLKPSLALRKDQLNELFLMLAESSFDWLVKAPTGFGKTALGSMVMATVLGKSPLTPATCKRGFRIGYITPNVDLCQQAKDEFLRFIDIGESEVAILNGKTPVKERRRIAADMNTKILVGTPETFHKAIEAAPTVKGFDSLALLIIDEFQCAEGDHSMARLIQTAKAAKVPILAQSGTPARDASDLSEKRDLLPLNGVLVPQTLQPLKKHDLLSSNVTPQMKTLIRELSDMTFSHYITAREGIANAEMSYKQAVKQETSLLFDIREQLTRKPHIVSFAAPTAKRTKELKEKIDKLRADIKEARELRKVEGLPQGPRLAQAEREVNLAALAVARIGSISASLSPLITGGRFPFLYDFAETWFSRYLESPKRVGNFPIFQDYMREPGYRGVIREMAAGTPFLHLLNASSGADALKQAFGLSEQHIPPSSGQRADLFLDLATNEMAQLPAVENEKEAKLFARIEELLERGQARGILVFAEPRHFTRYLALRLHYRFAQKHLRTAFITGDGDGFADHLANNLSALRTPEIGTAKPSLSPFSEIRAAFQDETTNPQERVGIIVATSRLAVGHNLSAAAEAHIYTMHADAQKLIQQIGRVGRPDGDNFYGRVGQCFYHVNRNTPEHYLFLSAIRKYAWIKDAMGASESWQYQDEQEPND